MAQIVDFFFSPHPTAGERRFRAAISDGLAHGSQIEPRDPEPGEPVTLYFFANATMPIERVAVYYTTDGTEPSGERGTSANSLVVLAESGETVTDPRVQLPVRHWRAVVPGQPDETLVRYHVDGWSLREPELRFRPPTNFVLASLRRSERNDLHWTADRVDPVTMVPENGRIFAYNVDRWDVPDWWYDTVTYHIVVDRFNAASDEP